MRDEASPPIRADSALQESEERYRHIVEQATDYAIFTTDPERRIETWPAGAEHVFGWSAEEAIGQLMDMTYTPEDQAAGVPVQEAEQARDEGRTPNVRWHQRQDGSRVFIEGMAYSRTADDGTFLGVFKVGQDVTSRVQTEGVRRRNEANWREELEAEITAATMELRLLSRRLLLVQEEERRHLARELHDEIGQMLTALNFQLAMIAGKAGTADVVEAQTTVQQLTEQVRQLSMDLRPAMLDRYGLLAALEWHLERYQQRTGILVHLIHEGLDRRFSSEVEITAYRIVQETLTNVARHADTRAATVQVIGNGDLLIVVRDRGKGFALDATSVTSGLGGMRERVELLGGTLEIESEPGAGTRVAAHLRLDADTKLPE